MIDFDPDADAPTGAVAASGIDLPWLIVGLCAAAVIAICAAAERVVRAGRRLAWRTRAAAGTRLIDAGVWIAPAPPVRHRAEIARLLERAVAIGKRRASGHGQVASWSIADAASWDLVEGGRLARSVPEGARDLIVGTPHGAPALGAWSPPAWQRALYRPVWVAGTEVTV